MLKRFVCLAALSIFALTIGLSPPGVASDQAQNAIYQVQSDAGAKSDCPKCRAAYAAAQKGEQGELTAYRIGGGTYYSAQTLCIMDGKAVYHTTGQPYMVNGVQITLLTKAQTPVPKVTIDKWDVPLANPASTAKSTTTKL